jgi:hypothetical protein
MAFPEDARAQMVATGHVKSARSDRGRHTARETSRDVDKPPASVKRSERRLPTRINLQGHHAMTSCSTCRRGRLVGRDGRFNCHNKTRRHPGHVLRLLTIQAAREAYCPPGVKTLHTYSPNAPLLFLTVPATERCGG